MRPKPSRNRVAIFAFTIAFSLILWAAWSDPPAPPPPQETIAATAATVDEAFTYQGRLTDPSGNPYNGTYEMRFFLVDAETGGTTLWDSGIRSVSVSDGLFSVELDAPQSVFNGQEVWLRIRVEGVNLSPRRKILPAPYALGLRPGAEMSGEPIGVTGHVLKVTKEGLGTGSSGVYGEASTGFALRGDSSGGVGVYGYTEAGAGVYGYDGGTPQGHGYGGYFTSSSGVGVYGYSSAQRYYSNQYAPGVFGKSANGIGVYGLSDSNWAGVQGESTDGIGVYGKSTNSYGVYGYSSTDDGVYGYSFGDYGGNFYSATYRGLYASSDTGDYAGYFVDRGGSAWPGVYIDGTLVASGSKSGYVVDICLNDGPEPLETGDVVEIVGAAPPAVGRIPLVRVRKTARAESTAVVGVVDQPFEVPPPVEESMEESPDVTSSDSPDGAEPTKVDPRCRRDLPKPQAADASVEADTGVAAQRHLSVVTLGAFRAIKVDATYGAIRPGDLLVSSPTPGHAMRADSPKIGTVVGKALGGLEEGQGRIPVFVSLK
ncbi:hypothetical protein JW916_10075 [Candidatus Sumerlaeota bacterium]|nr:hypothetical protein [Candidatus Sumerlaeota bacterium]